MQAITRKIVGTTGYAIDHYNLALTALGLLLAETEKFAEAEEVLGKAAVFAPKKATTRKYLGRVRLRLGRADAAIADLTTARNLDPSDPSIPAELGAALLLHGDARQAAIQLEKAVENNPSDGASRQLLERARKM